jgi:hypothetical protein
MPVLRFLASLFALVAVVALVNDATPALNGSAPFKATTVIGYWQQLAPASLEAARDGITQGAAPWIWNPVILSVLGMPTPVLFGLLALVCGFLGRRRTANKMHIN